MNWHISFFHHHQQDTSPPSSPTMDFADCDIISVSSSIHILTLHIKDYSFDRIILSSDAVKVHCPAPF